MATSWRSTRSSTSLVVEARAIRRTSPSTCQKIKYNNRSDTLGSCPPVDHRWSVTQTRVLAPHRMWDVESGVAAPSLDQTGPKQARTQHHDTRDKGTHFQDRRELKSLDGRANGFESLGRLPGS
jgi:hypothetical protein